MEQPLKSGLFLSERKRQRGEFGFEQSLGISEVDERQMVLCPHLCVSIYMYRDRESERERERERRRRRRREVG